MNSGVINFSKLKTPVYIVVAAMIWSFALIGKNVETEPCTYKLVYDDFNILTDIEDKTLFENSAKKVLSKLKNSKLIFQYLMPMPKPENHFKVRVFKGREGYVNYLGSSYTWSNGLWDSKNNELVLYITGLTPNEKKEFFRVLRHEAFHQYISSGTKVIELYPWLNEGFAMFAESLKLKGNKILFYMDSNKLSKLEKYLKESSITKNIGSVLNFDYNAFYSENIQRNYILSWGLVTYFMIGNSYTKRKTNHDYSWVLDSLLKAQVRNGFTQMVNKQILNKIRLELLADDMLQFFKYKAGSLVYVNIGKLNKTR